MSFINFLSHSFTRDGRYIVSRDYMSLKVWDLHMESKPVKVISVAEHLKPALGDLYEGDCIYDKFQVAMCPQSQRVVTGTYSNQLTVHNIDGQCRHALEIPPRFRDCGGGGGAGTAGSASVRPSRTGTSIRIPGRGKTAPKDIYVDQKVIRYTSALSCDSSPIPQAFFI
jgi:hypothetical protein